MLRFLRLMGVSDFPYTSVGVGVLIGLVVVYGIKAAFLRDTPMGIHVYVGLVVVGVTIGAFLALCWYVLEGNCWLGLSG